jgi:hypothetical protein
VQETLNTLECLKKPILLIVLNVFRCGPTRWQKGAMFSLMWMHFVPGDNMVISVRVVSLYGQFHFLLSVRPSCRPTTVQQVPGAYRHGDLILHCVFRPPSCCQLFSYTFKARPQFSPSQEIYITHAFFPKSPVWKDQVT